jgi:hypothetical protein
MWGKYEGPHRRPSRFKATHCYAGRQTAIMAANRGRTVFRLTCLPHRRSSRPYQLAITRDGTNSTARMVVLHGAAPTGCPAPGQPWPLARPAWGSACGSCGANPGVIHKTSQKHKQFQVEYAEQREAHTARRRSRLPACKLTQLSWPRLSRPSLYFDGLRTSLSGGRA